MSETVNIREWTLDCGTEPTVRIGVILDEDALDSIHLGLPSEPYTATFGDISEPRELEDTPATTWPCESPINRRNTRSR